jgi:hypothetical protein
MASVHARIVKKFSTKHPRSDCKETPAQRLQGESECLVSRAVAARAVAAPHGEMGFYRTARPHGRTAMR